MQAIVHFSGGSDSTLAAALCAEKYEKVHLLSYDRFSFWATQENTHNNYDNLVGIYGKNKFVRHVLPVGAWHKTINYDRYLYFARKYGRAVVSMTFCKLAMHWRSIVYARQNQIEAVVDGAVPYMRVYPDQNETICLRWLKQMYQELNLDYSSPVWDLAEDVEQLLYDRGITRHARIRGTADDKQVTYAEQFVFALFVKYYLDRYGIDQYEKVLSDLFAEKIEFIKTSIVDWGVSQQGSMVEGLLKRDPQ